MTEARSILTISHHRILQDTRTQILELAGHQVFAACNSEEAILRLENQDSLDVVLICHSIPEASARYLIDRIRALRPALPILLLCNGFHSHISNADGYMHSLDSPERMLELVDELTREKIQQRVRPKAIGASGAKGRSMAA